MLEICDVVSFSVLCVVVFVLCSLLKMFGMVEELLVVIIGKVVCIVLFIKFCMCFVELL